VPVWVLVIEVSLEFGAWGLVLGAYDLSWYDGDKIE
jgi:hypothetical protein